jgi:hypothetical protein
MDKKILMLCVALIIFSSAVHVHSETIPANIWEFTKDYYDVIGEPQLTASIVGNPEYESGDSSTVYIQLMNEGLIFGFEADKTPSSYNETMDAKAELDLEYDVTTAINIRGTLETADGNAFRILSGLQQAGSLRSSETSQPMEFDIEIFENAPTRTYDLFLYLTYQYQYDVKVEGYPDKEFNFWYITKNQTIPLQIIVKPRARFEIVKVSDGLISGEQGVLHITYKNTGDEVADDAVARISVVDPFSTTDDQAFLGTLNPDDSCEAQYKVKVDNDALPKVYGINTEVKYRDEHGDTQISDVMKASIEVRESVTLARRIGYAGYLLVIFVILGATGYYFYKKQGNKGK